MTRKPDYISIDSLYYKRFFQERNKELYPEIEHFFTALLNEQYPYKIIFDQESKVPPAWIYPQRIDFLHNRIIIFARKDLIGSTEEK